VFWFVRLGGTSGGVYAAVRSGDDWIATRAQLGPDASYFEPGAAAFYAGSVRMVVAAGNGQVGLLRELASADGIAWTVVADIDMPELADPALSPDGCQLLVSAVVGTGTRAIYVANRQPDGTFGMPVPTSMVMGADVGGPALDPTQSRLWFVDGGQLVQGTP